MLKAASSTYFETLWNFELQTKLKKNVLGLALQFANRRNDIAHASVEGFALKEKLGL